MSSSDLVPKSDIRHLIKVNKTQVKKVDHPHARYNQLGRISCIVCGIQIKSEFAWNAHVLSKTHKLNEAREQHTSLKRTVEPVHHSDVTLKPTHSKDSTCASTKSEPHSSVQDFLLDKTAIGDKNPAEKSRESESNSKLPEGFFDDKYKDAKARNVPYKDKLTTEVELFQKEMTALERQSQEILEKENVAMVSRRELDEIDAQLQKWRKIEELQVEKETLEERLKSRSHHHVNDPVTHVIPTIKRECTSSESGDDDDAELYDFRAKHVV